MTVVLYFWWLLAVYQQHTFHSEITSTFCPFSLKTSSGGWSTSSWVEWHQELHNERKKDLYWDENHDSFTQWSLMEYSDVIVVISINHFFFQWKGKSLYKTLKYMEPYVCFCGNFILRI